MQHHHRLLRRGLTVALLALAASCSACSPIYVIKAGIAEIQILRARQDIPELLSDSTLDPATRGKLSFVLEARRFAMDELGIDVGDAYTMFTQLERDTLALVVSAAHKDRLVPKTWWFPVVGRMPYKGFFSLEDAQKQQADLETEGYDTYLRPTAAFSTLGWFNDPILSTMLRADDVEVVETVLHELSHRYLFVSGHVGFNESFATFVGRAGAAQFFCTREGGGPDTLKCRRAQARWRDYQRFSVFIDEMMEELNAIYDDARLQYDEKISQRGGVFDRSIVHFDADVALTFESVTFRGFRNTPLNNATLLARVRYYHRLPDFAALLDARGGDLAAVLEELKRNADTVEDPFEMLPSGGNYEDLRERQNHDEGAQIERQARRASTATGE
jgi:predicted aminopeptidase